MSTEVAGPDGSALSEGLGLAPEREVLTWYEVRAYGAPTITPVRVLRETAYQIVLADCSPGNARRAKADTYFPTWQEAHEHLMRTAHSELEAARYALMKAQSRYGNVKGMKA